MALTGRPDGPPRIPDGPVLRNLAEVTSRIKSTSAMVGRPVEVELTEVLTLRAGILGLGRRGSTSANGSCRLLASMDGWAAVNLPRPQDVASLEAALGAPVGEDPWVALERAASCTPAAEFVDRLQTLGVPAAVLGSQGGPPWRSRSRGVPRRPRALEELTVVDLSSLWAGPLCARLLGLAGAKVMKVESAQRPDTGRDVPEFYRWLHPDHNETVVDLGSEVGRARLRQLLGRADVVIEASRARALDQLEAGPEDIAPRPGQVWLTITGYGRSSNRVAFGDDAAAAGGLVALDGHTPVFCADAIADPVSGLHAALATLEALAHGGGEHIDLSMSDSAAHAMRTRPTEPGCPGTHETYRDREGNWRVRCGQATALVAAPRRPQDGTPSATRAMFTG
jgi:hypothetical protein